MKICLVTKDFPPTLGGISTQSFLLASWLSNKNIEVYVLTMGKCFKEDFRNEFNIIRLAVPIDNQLTRATSFQFNVWKWLRNNDFDIIQFQEGSGFIYFLFNIFHRKKNTIYTFHHSPISELKFYLKFFFKIPRESLIYILFTVYIIEELFCLKMSDKIVTVSNYSKSVLLSWGFNKNKISVVLNGMSCDTCNKSNKIKAIENVRFLFVGRLVPRKGIDILLKAAHLLSKKNIIFNLDMVGVGPLKKYVEFQINKHNLSNIKVHGKISDSQLKNFYEKSDIFICPSYLEGFGIVLLEAACNNLAIIANDIPVFKEIFNDNEILYFKNGDSKELAKKIEYLISNTNKIHKLQEKSKKKVTDFNLDRTYEKYIEIYNSINEGQ